MLGGEGGECSRLTGWFVVFHVRIIRLHWEHLCRNVVACLIPKRNEQRAENAGDVGILGPRGSRSSFGMERFVSNKMSISDSLLRLSIFKLKTNRENV